MKSNIARKLIMGLAATCATAICLTSTTYAWFAKNANAWTEEFTIRLHTEEGLEISVDGINYYDTITKSQLTKAIALQRYNLVNDQDKTYAELTEAEVNSYGTTSLSPVSPDSNWNFWGYNTVDYAVEDPNEYIDGTYYMPVNLTEKKATASYLKFDLYFRAIPSSNDPKDSYKLIFADEAHDEGMGVSYIKGDNSTIKLHHELKVLESKDTRTLGPTDVLGTYKAEDEIEVNPANAMRIGVAGNINKIYELNEGLGSSAYLNAPEGLHDPNTNPMVTYFNNTHQRADLYLRDYATEYVETVKNFDGLESLGNFTRNSEGNYNVVTATFYVWLDGFDADYLEGVDTNSIRFFLNFTKVEG